MRVIHPYLKTSVRDIFNGKVHYTFPVLTALQMNVLNTSSMQGGLDVSIFKEHQIW